MRERYIEGMVRRLSPILKDKSKAHRILKNYWSDKMALVWDTEDVYRAANEREVALTRKEAIQVLQDLHTHHNHQLGIKWEDVTAQIEDKVLGRKLTKRELRRFVDQDIITINK